MGKKHTRLVLDSLRQNAREKLTSLSRTTNVPISSLHDIIKNTHGSLVLKHTSLINFEQLGYKFRASIMIKVAKEERDDVQKFLSQHDVVNNLYKVNNGYDFQVEGVFVDVKHMSDFLEDVETQFTVEKQNFHPIIQDLVRENFSLSKSLQPFGKNNNFGG